MSENVMYLAYRYNALWGRCAWDSGSGLVSPYVSTTNKCFRKQAQVRRRQAFNMFTMGFPSCAGVLCICVVAVICSNFILGYCIWQLGQEQSSGLPHGTVAANKKPNAPADNRWEWSPSFRCTHTHTCQPSTFFGYLIIIEYYAISAKNLDTFGRLEAQCLDDDESEQCASSAPFSVSISCCMPSNVLYWLKMSLLVECLIATRTCGTFD